MLRNWITHRNNKSLKWQESCKKWNVIWNLRNMILNKSNSQNKFKMYSLIAYTLCHKKNIGTQKKLKQNHVTCHEYNLTGDMQIIKILMSTRQG